MGAGFGATGFDPVGALVGKLPGPLRTVADPVSAIAQRTGKFEKVIDPVGAISRGKRKEAKQQRRQERQQPDTLLSGGSQNEGLL